MRGACACAYLQHHACAQWPFWRFKGATSAPKLPQAYMLSGAKTPYTPPEMLPSAMFKASSPQQTTPCTILCCFRQPGSSSARQGELSG